LVGLQEMLPGFINSLIKLAVVKTPHFKKSKCLRCAKCIEICPAQILSFKDDKRATTGANGKKFSKHVTIQRSKCLHCFCCHEICPVSAIKLY